MTSPRYSDLISEAAGTGVEYTGDFLTNSTIHARLKQIGAELGDIGAGLGVHEQMQGATAEAAREALGGSRVGLQGVEDALSAISGAATGASSAIDTGKSTDAAVKAAQAQSEAVYAAHSAGAGEDPDEKVADDETTTGGDDKGGDGGPYRAMPREADRESGSTPAGPNTHTSSDSDANRGSGAPGSGGAPSTTAPSSTTAQPVTQQQMPMTTAQPMMGQAGGGGQQPGGMPMNASPKTTTGSPDYSRMIREAIAEEKSRAAAKAAGPIPRGISPKSDPSASDGPAVVAAPVPSGNPTVTGGAVDPAQTSGRTASTTTSGAPGAGVPAKPTGPMPMGGGMMGGMGPMGQGLGGNQPAAGPQSPPKIRRDRETEAVLDGTAASDKALIASILRDDDLITSGTDDEATDALLDDLRNDEPSAPPQRPGEPEENEKW